MAEINIVEDVVFRNANHRDPGPYVILVYNCNLFSHSHSKQLGQFSIHGFFDRQYDEITTYHGTVSLSDKVTEDEILEIGRELDRPPRRTPPLPPS